MFVYPKAIHLLEIINLVILRFSILKALGNLFEAIDLTSKLYQQNYDRNMTAFSDATYDLCSKTYKQVTNMFYLSKF